MKNDSPRVAPKKVEVPTATFVCPLKAKAVDEILKRLNREAKAKK